MPLSSFLIYVFLCVCVVKSLAIYFRLLGFISLILSGHIPYPETMQKWLNPSRKTEVARLQPVMNVRAQVKLNLISVSFILSEMTQRSNQLCFSNRL